MVVPIAPMMTAAGQTSSLAPDPFAFLWSSMFSPAGVGGGAIPAAGVAFDSSTGQESAPTPAAAAPAAPAAPAGSDPATAAVTKFVRWAAGL
jgi:hypothetical protein